MAKKPAAKTPAPSFHEAVFKGSPKAVRGLVAGLLIGSGQDDAFWFHKDTDIADPSAPRTVRRAVEKLHLMPVSEVRVVVDGNLAKLLRSHRTAIAASGVCELAELVRIKQARATLSYHTFARQYDDEVKALLASLPRGVKLADHNREVKRHPESKGIESYAPAHDYESCGDGALTGRFDLILAIRNQLDAHPLITFEPLDLVIG